MRTSVDVICMYPKNGLIRPLSIVWNNGANYPVRRITQVIPIDGDEDHSCGLRYTCRIGNSVRYLFLENGKWFIEKL
ncbi:MAG: hypothetical protein IKE93_02945 [Erysipelotrichaceae bacterium]|nr:hypothetical protein [Erysipelotrichaceae bacterium]